ncbi:hypothetical protein [Streptomyces avermitilis]|uniref:hypothetical protein n=1 Tax=Streptomyces avermitilis TaxID=33903 RepID=UPI0033D462FE
MFFRSSAFRSAIKSRVGRIAAAGAATAIAISLSASPASADSYKYIYLPSGRGYFEFIDNGDTFQLCDTKADGQGVSAYLIRRDPLNNKQTFVVTMDDGGDSSCATKTYNINDYYDYQMGVWWHGDGTIYSNDWFHE